MWPEVVIRYFSIQLLVHSEVKAQVSVIVDRSFFLLSPLSLAFTVGLYNDMHNIVNK